MVLSWLMRIHLACAEFGIPEWGGLEGGVRPVA